MRPPKAFFDLLEQKTQAARAKLKAEGYEPVGFECLPLETDGSWWDVRSVRVFGIDAKGQTRRILFDVNPETFRRPVRRVKRTGPLQVRIHRGLEFHAPSLGEDLIKALKSSFTYKNPELAKKQRLGLWTGGTERNIRTWEMCGETLVLPRGGTDKVRQILQAHDRWPIEIIDDRLELPSFEFKAGPKAEPVTLREDQEMLLAAMLERENCLIRAAAGMGKSEVGIELIRRVRQPALVIVWSSGLMKQWVERIAKRFGWPKSKLGSLGGGKARVGDVTVAMQQTLYRRAGEFEDKFGLLILDECQRASSRSFREVVSRFPARYRFGISADERRKDRMEFLTEDYFGQVAAEVDKKELIAKGKLCEVEIVVVPTDVTIEEIEHSSPMDRGALIGIMWAEILDRLTHDEKRNRLIVELAAKEVRAGESVIVFTDRVAHARLLSREITLAGIPCGLCLGGPENRDEFEESCTRLASGELKVSVATSCMYQGQDIPRLTVGIVATPTGNNRQLFEQQVGRLRRVFPGKRKGRLYYCLDRIFPRHVDNFRQWYGARLVRFLDA